VSSALIIGWFVGRESVRATVMSQEDSADIMNAEYVLAQDEAWEQEVMQECMVCTLHRKHP
jgi:hypothetical protein